jgi:hypothetical protein
MNRTNSLIILGAITLSIFLLFNTAITIPMIEVSAIAEPKEEYEKEERSYDDYSSPMMMNDYYAQEPPLSTMMAEEGKWEYNPDRYGGYYGHYEGDFYLDQYNDGNPYDDGGNGSPYIIG